MQDPSQLVVAMDDNASDSVDLGQVMSGLLGHKSRHSQGYQLLAGVGLQAGSACWVHGWGAVNHRANVYVFHSAQIKQVLEDESLALPVGPSNSWPIQVPFVT